MRRMSTPDLPPRSPLRADLRAALRGTDADYTRIPLKRAVFLLAVPMMLELVLTRPDERARLIRAADSTEGPGSAVPATGWVDPRLLLRPRPRRRDGWSGVVHRG